MKEGSKLLWIARSSLLASAVGILLASFFFYNPRNYAFGINFSPQISQMLLYGGFVLLIALFAWWWPIPGGIIAVLYGTYKFLEYFRFIDYPLTMVPIAAYCILYGVFITGGVLSIRAGLKIPTAQPPEADVYEWLRQAARITTAAPVIVAIIYSIGLAAVIMLRISLYSPDSLLSGMIFLSPLLLVVTYIAWRWSAPGGLLALATGIPVLLGILSSNWGMAYEIPYTLFCGVFITGGILHLLWAFLTRIQAGVKR